LDLDPDPPYIFGPVGSVGQWYGFADPDPYGTRMSWIPNTASDFVLGLYASLIDPMKKGIGILTMWEGIWILYPICSIHNIDCKILCFASEVIHSKDFGSNLDHPYTHSVIAYHPLKLLYICKR
jgi:hypothetical protein